MGEQGVHTVPASGRVVVGVEGGRHARGREPGRGTPAEAQRARAAGRTRRRARAAGPRPASESSASSRSGPVRESSAPVRVRMARSSPRFRATVSPVGRSGRTETRRTSTPPAASRPVTNRPKWSSPTAGDERDGAAEPGQAVGGDRRRAAEHQGGLVEQLLGLAEAGLDVAAQHQVRVGVADHEHPGGASGGTRRGSDPGPVAGSGAEDTALSWPILCTSVQKHAVTLLFLDRFVDQCHARAMTTISFVGAGSAEFTRQLLRDLLSYDDLGPLDAGAARRRRAPAPAGRRRGAADRRPPRASGGGAGRGGSPDRAGRGGLRGQHRERRRPRRDAHGLRGARPVRRTPDDRRHARRGRGLPCAAHLPGARRAGPRHRGGVSGRVAAQLHQPDGDEPAVPRGPPPAGEGARAVPLGVLDRARPVRAGRRAAGRGDLPQRRGQPPGVGAALGARRREPLPAARRAHRRRPGATAPGARRPVPATRLLPDGDQRALQRVRAVVPPRRRRDRPAADPGRRLHRHQCRERRRHRGARGGRGRRPVRRARGGGGRVRAAGGAQPGHRHARAPSR